jgi:transcriptional regulator with XRE-family HTH domain
MSKSRRSEPSGRIDRHIGARIRERRTMLGVSQQQFAKRIGLSHQQAHKYEHGTNRVSAGRLYEISRVLDTPITYFYEGLGDEEPPQFAPSQRVILEIARNFTASDNERHREALSEVVRILAGASRREAEINTRQQARDRGLGKYMTGKPCKHGHVAERRTDTGNCTECQRLAQQRYKAGSGTVALRTDTKGQAERCCNAQG